MPTIPSMILSSQSVDASEIYQNGLYAPANPPQSVEVLNGGLEQSNYTGGNGTIKPYMMDLGTFARGYSVNFGLRDIVYARQLDQNTEDHYIISSSLSTTVFLPFKARVIQFGFQCWFNHDASRYVDEDDNILTEYWGYRLRVFPSSATNPAYTEATSSTEGRLPFGRLFDNGTWNENNGVHEEARWYYVHKSSMLPGIFNEGYRDLRLEIFANIEKPNSGAADRKIDEYFSKCQQMNGTLWVLALR